MSDIDGLDALERELGPSLQLALRRAAAEITVDDDPVGSPDLRLDVGPAWGATRDRRWWLVAAVAAVLLLIAGVAVQTARDDDVGTVVVPAGPRQTVTTGTTVTTAPRTADAILPPTGAAPSSPETGELVASLAQYHQGAWNLYADGRLVSIDDQRCCEWLEQRLTPDGVELVRSAFLTSGLFDPDQPSADPPPDDNPFAACPCVRDGDKLLSTVPAGGAGPRQPGPAEAALIEYLRDLPSSVPASEWVDQTGRPFVAAKQGICFFHSAPTGIPEPLTDLPAVVASLPPTAAELLAGRDRTSHLVTALQIPSACVNATNAEARTVAEALVAAFGVTDIFTATHGTFPGIRANLDEPTPMVIDITFWPLLPAGGLQIWGG